jgi:hypothetical protein
MSGPHQFRAVVTSISPDLRDNESNIAASFSLSLHVSSGVAGACGDSSLLDPFKSEAASLKLQRIIVFELIMLSVFV